VTKIINDGERLEIGMRHPNGEVEYVDITEQVQGMQERAQDGVDGQYDSLPDVLKGRIGGDVAVGLAGVASLGAKVKMLRDANDVEIARLAREGISVQVPSVDMLKFSVLLDMLLGPESSTARLTYDLRVQMTIQAELDKVSGQANRAKLLAPATGGTPGPSGLVVPGR
jgi:hypothetical protein